jgi:nicotinic acid mononucleotide adenylyltransferase
MRIQSFIEFVNEKQLSDKPQTKDLVLVNDGSFNPVHRAHIQVTLDAKKYAEKIGYNVVGLYILPKHRTWLEKKFGKNSPEIIPDKMRFEFLKEAISGTDITLDDWELKSTQYSDNKQIRDHYERIHPGATYVMVVGQDYGKCFPMPCFEIENGTWQLRMIRTGEISSTKIRANSKSGLFDDLNKITYPKVISYMKQRELQLI